MAYVLKTNIANKANYGSKRDLSTIKYIAIHYTGNDGDTDENNGKYFKNNVVQVSAHYFVDDDSVTQSVPDNYVAYSVGGSKYSDCATTGGGKLHGKATNYNTLNIEICDDVRNGVVYPSAKTIENAIELTKKKMEEYNIPKENVIRHFDVSGKRCPSYWCGTTERESKWKTEFWNKLSPSVPATEIYRIRKTWADASSQIGAYSVLESAKAACKAGYSVFNSKGEVVYSVAEPVKTSTFLPSRGYFKKGDKGKNVEKINNFYYTAFPGYASVLKRNKENVKGNLFGENTEAWTKEFQRRTGLEPDGFIGKITLAELKKYGFKE